MTVFAAAGGPDTHATDAVAARHDLAHAIATALTGSAVLMAGALAVIVVAVWRPSAVRDVVAGADAVR